MSKVLIIGCGGVANVAIRNTLEEIPEDASVAAGTFYASYLSQREILPGKLTICPIAFSGFSWKDVKLRDCPSFGFS